MPRPSAHPTPADLSSAKPSSFGQGFSFSGSEGRGAATFPPQPGLRMGVFYGGESHRWLFDEVPERRVCFPCGYLALLELDPFCEIFGIFGIVNMLMSSCDTSCNPPALISPCNSTKWGNLEVKMTALGGPSSCKPPYGEEGPNSHGHRGVDMPAGAPW